MISFSLDIGHVHSIISLMPAINSIQFPFFRNNDLQSGYFTQGSCESIFYVTTLFLCLLVLQVISMVLLLISATLKFVLCFCLLHCISKVSICINMSNYVMIFSWLLLWFCFTGWVASFTECMCHQLLHTHWQTGSVLNHKARWSIVCLI